MRVEPSGNSAAAEPLTPPRNPVLERATSIALRSSRGALWGAIAYVLLAAALFGALGLSLGWVPAALSGLVLVTVATVPGAALVRLLLPRAGLLHFVVLGTTFGLMLWALGGFLSHVTGLFVVRWLPAVLAVILYVVVRIRQRLPAGDPRPVPLIGVIGAMVGLVAMIPALRTALASQPALWEGWVSHYPDLPFQVAITAEVASRVPGQAPWVAGTPLSYTWAFHSAMGVWSSASSVPAFEVVLQAWPVLFTALIPGLIAVVAWELSRNPWVAAAAPVLFTLAHGVLMAPTTFVQVPIFTISPTRDFGHLAILIVILSLYRTLGVRQVRIPWLIALALGMVVATASKGSLMPILLGGVLTACFMLVLLRRFAWSDLVSALSFGVGALVGFVVAIPDTGSAQSLSWGPLTFLGSGTDNRVMLSVAILGLLLAGIVGLWVLLGRSVDWILASLLAGTILAGWLGLALLTQTGGSQNYFWQGAEPLLSIALAWCGVILVRRFGLRVVFVALGITLLGNIGLRVTSNPVALAIGVIALALAGAVILMISPAGRRAPHRWLEGLVLALVLTQAAQLVGLSAGYQASVVSTAADESATHSSQLAALEFIRSNSNPDDIIVTNTHCRTGSLAGDDCDPRRFMIAAVAQRRVLVEGWGYTQNGDSPEWVQEQLDLSDDFIGSPSAGAAQELIDLGVRYVYVDLRLEPSPFLADVSTLVFESEWARVYRLTD